MQTILQCLYMHPNNTRFSLNNVTLLILFLQIPVTSYPLIHNYFPAPFPNTLNPTLLPCVRVYIISHFVIIFRPTHTPSILLGYIPTIHQIFFQSLFWPCSENPLENEVRVLWESVVCNFFLTKWALLNIPLHGTSVVVDGIPIYETHNFS